MNATTVNNQTEQTEQATQATELMIHATAENAGLSATEGQKTIVCRFRNPSRLIAVNIPNDAFTMMQTAVTDKTFQSLLDGVLTEACKAIISRYYMSILESAKTTASFIPAALLTSDEILSEAAGNNSDWMSKEDLTEAWKNSATRASLYNQEKYTANPAYRRAYTHFEEMVTKLAGKTASYKPEELDVILAKLADADMATPFGGFVLRRIESIKNKPTTSGIDFDAL